MLVGRENAGDTGHHDFAVPHQRVARVLFGCSLQLARHEDRTHLHWRRFEIRNDEIGFEGTCTSILIFAHHDLEVILAGWEVQTGIVLHVLALHLVAALTASLTVSRISPAGNFRSSVMSPRMSRVALS